MKYKDLPPDKQVGPYVWNHQAHLGSGAYGKVYLGRDTKSNNKLVAIKVMENKQISDPYLQQALQNEINILKTLKGNNVVGLYDYLQTKSRTYIIQMFCNQGDFRSYLTKKTKLPEPEAKRVLSDLLTGFKELVDHNLVHRDLKPENILIHDNVFKVADYGFGKQIQNSKQILQTCCGTPLYMSPQILQNQQYTSKSDVWSMGLIYYEMLFGTTPWQCRSQYELVQKTSKEPVKFPYGCKISKESQNFILGCLQVNEAKRLSWQEVFKHPVYEKKCEELSYGKEIQITNQTRQIITQIQQSLLELMEQKGIDIETLFRKVDTSGNRSLDQRECLQFLKYIMPSISEQDAMGIFQTFDSDHSGSVNFQEFSDFFCNTNFAEKQEENNMLDEYRAQKLVKKLIDIINDNNIDIARLFKKFDYDGDQTLNLPEFTKILKLIDETLLDKEAAYIFKKFDKDHSGSLSLSEFQKIVYQGVEGLGGDPFNKKDYGAVKGKMSQEAQQLIQTLRKTIIVNNLDPVIIFQKFDRDNSGELNMQEFAELVRVVNARLTNEQIQEIFRAFDQNNDKTLSIQEFKAQVL